MGLGAGSGTVGTAEVMQELSRGCSRNADADTRGCSKNAEMGLKGML